MDFQELDAESDPGRLRDLLLPWLDSQATRYRDKHVENEKNALFYLGKHWIEKKTGTDGFVIYEEDDEHFYPVTNYVKYLANFKLNQISGKRVVPIVKAASLNPKAISDARLGHLALRARYKMDAESSVDRIVCLHAAIFGIGWRTVYKEIDTEQFLAVPRMQKVDTSQYTCPTCNYQSPNEPTCPQCGVDSTFEHKIVEQQAIDETGAPAIDKKPIYNVSSRAVDPFRIMTTLTHTAKDRHWLVDTSLQPVDWVKENFAVEAPGYIVKNALKVEKTKKIPRAVRVSEQLKSAFELKNSAIFNSVTSPDREFKNDEETALFYKIYLAPSPRFKTGRLIVMTPDFVIYDGKPDTPQINPRYRWWHPYKDFVWDIHPMNSEGTSFIGDLIPKNKQLNAIDAIMLEYMDKTAAPQEVRYDNVKQNNDDNTDGIMEIEGIPGLPNGGAPFYLNHPPMPQDMMGYRQRLIVEMKELASVSDVQLGQHTPGVDTFRGLKLLQETAESSESDLYNRWYEYVEDYNCLKLCLIQECMIQPDSDLSAMMQTLNEQDGNSADAIKDFTGLDIGDQWEIETEETDYLSDTQSAKAEAVQEAIKGGIITPQELADPVTKYNIVQRLGLGDTVEVMGSADIKKAEWIIKLLEGMDFARIQQVLKPYDNKSIQLAVLTAWMKKPRFYDLDPRVQGSAEQLMGQLQQAIPPPPPPPGPPVKVNLNMTSQASPQEIEQIAGLHGSASAGMPQGIQAPAPHMIPSHVGHGSVVNKKEIPIFPKPPTASPSGNGV